MFQHLRFVITEGKTKYPELKRSKYSPNIVSYNVTMNAKQSNGEVKFKQLVKSTVVSNDSG